jgi:RNA-directed DNA polymerase
MQIVNNFANGTKTPTDWQSINWKKANRLVRNLRQRIFRATQAGNWKKVRSLQKLMLRSLANRQVAVRRVTQINKGKNTPGVDKMVVKTAVARGRLLDDLAHYTLWKAKPTRRVYIAKTNGKLRPLSIPVIMDRALQTMVKNALEPSWEGRFESTSYGFRPGRSCQDGIAKIFNVAAKGKKRWILDADIRGAFDEICQDFLLEAIGPTPGKELIRQWLKAGYLDKIGTFHQTESGTPQGGVISPLLLNIALHGMETALDIKWSEKEYPHNKRAIIKYADDIVVLCESQEDAHATKQILSTWLSQRGLSWSEEKTRIVTLEEGFNFLGFNIRRYKSKITKSGWKLLIKPSKEAVAKHRKRLKQEWKALRGHNIQAILRKLNPIIRGWGNYFRGGVAKKTFGKLDYWMYFKEIRYSKHTHPNKPKQWWKARYFGKLNLDRQDKWVFGDKQTGAYLIKYSWFPIKRHTLVKGRASPDDATLREYWRARNEAKAGDLTPSKHKLAQRQKGICPVCGETLFNEEELHIHHKKPRAKGGTSNYGNLQLVHLYCHQQLHLGEETKDEPTK